MPKKAAKNKKRGFKLTPTMGRDVYWNLGLGKAVKSRKKEVDKHGRILKSAVHGRILSQKPTTKSAMPAVYGRTLDQHPTTKSAMPAAKKKATKKK